MKMRVQKWGNSLGVRIPKRYAELLDWNQNTEVRQTVEGGKLIIERVEVRPYDLGALLAGVTPENLHGETGTGDSVGAEEW